MVPARVHVFDDLAAQRCYDWMDLNYCISRNWNLALYMPAARLYRDTA